MTDEMSFDEQLRLERKGEDAGLNPMFGEWQHRFDFPPVPYGNGAAQRGEFRAAIQAELKNRWLYSNEIHLEITLHVDVQTTLETDDAADLDNYAKAILDGLKGPNGIMIDDTQVQALTISWIDGYGPQAFTIAAKGSPDDFVLKPQEFYEMPDGLWYPHGRYLWSQGGSEPCDDFNHFAGLSIMELMSSTKRRARAEMRKGGADRLRSYQQAMYLSNSARGFHRSRIEDGFPMHARREWQAERARWAEADSERSTMIEESLRGIQVLSPRLERHPEYEEGPIPHVYVNREEQSLPYLCLFDPFNGEWTLSDLLAETTVPWAARYLYFYEGWLLTGKWSGGGRHPTQEELDGTQRPKAIAAV